MSETARVAFACPTLDDSLWWVSTPGFDADGKHLGFYFTCVSCYRDKNVTQFSTRFEAELHQIAYHDK